MGSDKEDVNTKVNPKHHDNWCGKASIEGAVLGGVVYVDGKEP